MGNNVLLKNMNNIKKSDNQTAVSEEIEVENLKKEIRQIEGKSNEEPVGREMSEINEDNDADLVVHYNLYNYKPIIDLDETKKSVDEDYKKEIENEKNRIAERAQEENDSKQGELVDEENSSDRTLNKIAKDDSGKLDLDRGERKDDKTNSAGQVKLLNNNKIDESKFEPEQLEMIKHSGYDQYIIEMFEAMNTNKRGRYDVRNRSAYADSGLEHGFIPDFKDKAETFDEEYVIKGVYENIKKYGLGAIDSEELKTLANEVAHSIKYYNHYLRLEQFPDEFKNIDPDKLYEERLKNDLIEELSRRKFSNQIAGKLLKYDTYDDKIKFLLSIDPERYVKKNINDLTDRELVLLKSAVGSMRIEAMIALTKEEKLRNGNGRIPILGSFYDGVANTGNSLARLIALASNKRDWALLNYINYCADKEIFNAWNAKNNVVHQLTENGVQVFGEAIPYLFAAEGAGGPAAVKVAVAAVGIASEAVSIDFDAERNGISDYRYRSYFFTNVAGNIVGSQVMGKVVGKLAKSVKIHGDVSGNAIIGGKTISGTVTQNVNKKYKNIGEKFDDDKVGFGIKELNHNKFVKSMIADPVTLSENNNIEKNEPLVYQDDLLNSDYKELSKNMQDAYDYDTLCGFLDSDNNLQEVNDAFVGILKNQDEGLTERGLKAQKLLNIISDYKDKHKYMFQRGILWTDVLSPDTMRMPEVYKELRREIEPFMPPERRYLTKSKDSGTEVNMMNSKE